MGKRDTRLPKEDFEKKSKSSKMTDEIICPHCKKPSGWKSRDMIYVKGEFSLKCQQCGHPCAKIMCGRKESSEEYLNQTAKKYKNPDSN